MAGALLSRICEQNAREFTAPRTAHCHSPIPRRAALTSAHHCQGGESHLFFKSAAKRNQTPPTAAPPPAPAPAAAPLTVESLGQQLRETLPTRRLQSISLCDHEANVLWLSE